VGRPIRINAGGLVYHVLNRANARAQIFEDDHDYAAFERVLAEAVERTDMRLLCYLVMPNHWHLVVWPREDGDLSRFAGWLTLTHTQRWHAHRNTAGTGHLYQGRFKSFVVESNEHLFSLGRYVERNALRANLVERAEDWHWSSLWRLVHGDADSRSLLSNWPVPRPRDWLKRVNRALTAAELKALRHCLQRGTPYGSPDWVERTAQELGLETTLRPRGRPRQKKGS
jgi:REP-associated tyrosine transposase